MAKSCQICNRKAAVGNTRSHSRIASKRTMSLNLQSKKIDGQKKIICTSCLKNLNKQKTKA